MADAPAVSMVMGAFQAERFLRASVESLLAQTFPDFELVVVDDGSTDGTAGILDSFEDPRVRVLRNERNLGLPASLNRGVSAARAPLVGRLDADDLAEPERLERQVRTLRARPELAVLGSWTVEIDEEGREVGRFRFPASEGLIRWAMAVTNVVYHPSVLMRREALESVGGYRPEVECADDYDLFTRILRAGGRIDLLPEPLIRYRRSEGQTSARRVERQRDEALDVRQEYIEWLTGTRPERDVVEAFAALQSRGDRSPASPLLPAALELQRRVRRSCLDRADATARSQILLFSRKALLHHVARLRELGRLSDAARVYAELLRSGPGAWRHAATRREGLHLGRMAVAGAPHPGDA